MDMHIIIISINYKLFDKKPANCIFVAQLELDICRYLNRMCIKNMKSIFVLFAGISILSISSAHADIASKNSYEYNNGSCIKDEVVKEVMVGTDDYVHFRVRDHWFKYYNYINNADTQAAYKILLASLITGNTISAGYGTSSCSSNFVSTINMHDS
ncbi:hypothetical protein [Haematospirillum jordaniae]|uniref:hypothetical protein n=1 Tax=Haematospirillum jordaniae TaxID=1549855 RepID=UPI0014333206|nr:hypothetical protein [Haematospirillum jordaniae]